MHARRRVRERGFEIDDGIQRVDVHDDVAQRVFGDVAAVCHNHRNRLPDVPHFAAREREMRAGMKDQPLDRRRRHEQRRRHAIRAEIIRGVDRHHARPLPRARDLHTTQHAVGVVAAHERHMQHARQLHVVYESRPAGEQSGVLVAENAGADITAVRCRRCHRVPSVALA